jgi:hypothetical protein
MLTPRVVRGVFSDLRGQPKVKTRAGSAHPFATARGRSVHTARIGHEGIGRRGLHARRVPVAGGAASHTKIGDRGWCIAGLTPLRFGLPKTEETVKTLDAVPSPAASQQHSPDTSNDFPRVIFFNRLRRVALASRPSIADSTSTPLNANRRGARMSVYSFRPTA